METRLNGKKDLTKHFDLEYCNHLGNSCNVLNNLCGTLEPLKTRKFNVLLDGKDSLHFTLCVINKGTYYFVEFKFIYKQRNYSSLR